MLTSRGNWRSIGPLAQVHAGVDNEDTIPSDPERTP
jgi:hypothetical protein